MPSTSKEKRDGRRKRVAKKIRYMKNGTEFTSQDLATKCNLTPFVVGHIISQLMEKYQVIKIKCGKYKIVRKLKW